MEPRLADEGVYFRVANGAAERECLISKNVLAYLGRHQGHIMSFMNTYRACEARIQSVARRLVTAGESASPLVLGTAYFVDGATSSEQ